MDKEKRARLLDRIARRRGLEEHYVESYTKMLREVKEGVPGLHRRAYNAEDVVFFERIVARHVEARNEWMEIFDIVQEAR